MVQARHDIYLSPSGKEIWDGSCGRDFVSVLPSLATMPTAAKRCSLENPCSIPFPPVSAGPCNLHFLPGNYGGVRLDYYGNLVDTASPEVNLTFGDMSNSGSISGLSVIVHLMINLESLTPARLNVLGANPSSNTVLTNGKLVANGALHFNTFVSGLDFVDFPISVMTDMITTVFPGLFSFKNCNFQYMQSGLEFYVRPPSRFFPNAMVAHFEAHFENAKISGTRNRAEMFILGYNMTELDLTMKNVFFDGGVLLQAMPGGNFKNLKFENSVISTSAPSLFAPSQQNGIGLFNSLKVLGGTRLRSSGKLFNFFPPGYPANPGISNRYLEQLTMHDVNLEGVSIRASFSQSSKSQPAFKNVNCVDCALYLNAAGEPYFEGQNHFDLTSFTSSLHLNFDPFTSVFHMGQLSVYVNPELDEERPFYMKAFNGLETEGSLSTNMVFLSPGYYEFESGLNITEFVTTFTSGKPAHIATDPGSVITLGSINAFNIALELQYSSYLNYHVTDPSNGIVLSPDMIFPGVSIRVPNELHILWSPSLPRPQLNKWYPLVTFVDKLPQRIIVDQNGPLKGLRAELAMQPFRTGQQAVFRFHQ